MEITLREDVNVTILNLKGRLDLAAGSALKEQVKQLFAKEKTTVHLNLGGVEFINSSGLGSLVSIVKEVRQHKGRLRCRIWSVMCGRSLRSRSYRRSLRFSPMKRKLSIPTTSSLPPDTGLCLILKQGKGLVYD